MMYRRDERSWLDEPLEALVGMFIPLSQFGMSIGQKKFKPVLDDYNVLMKMRAGQIKVSKHASNPATTVLSRMIENLESMRKEDLNRVYKLGNRAVSFILMSIASLMFAAVPLTVLLAPSLLPLTLPTMLPFMLAGVVVMSVLGAMVSAGMALSTFRNLHRAKQSASTAGEFIETFTTCKKNMEAIFMGHESGLGQASHQTGGSEAREASEMVSHEAQHGVSSERRASSSREDASAFQTTFESDTPPLSSEACQRRSGEQPAASPSEPVSLRREMVDDAVKTDAVAAGREELRRSRGSAAP